MHHDPGRDLIGDGSKAAFEKQEKPTLTLDEALVQLKNFLTQVDRPSILELSGISPEIFEAIHRRTQVDASQFPGYENARLVNFVIDDFLNIPNGCPCQNRVFSKELHLDGEVCGLWS
jgi:hypothetical protein